jgi:hypothetical protein
VVRGSRREGLSFPLVLQVLDSTEGRRFGYGRVGLQGRQAGGYTTRKIITVSDGFYSKVDCFWLEGNHNLELYSIIKVQNIDFDHNYERGRELPRIAGMILDFTVVKRGSEIGYFSGKPVKLRDRDNGRGVEHHLLQDSLSQKLWKQVKEERFCDVTFTFPGGQGQVVKAQKNALIANSPVFEVCKTSLSYNYLWQAQFEGGFADASSDSVPIEDTEPKYMRGLLQFIFTRFLPLLSLRQAFEMLYLARKYLIEDLENYCKNFILNNKQTLAGVTDVFLYLEMNVKACDDDVRQFAWAQLRSKANVFIRQPRFNEIDFNTLESFLAERELNCHEWELAQALRRWIQANDCEVQCDSSPEAACPHQLLEAIRWETVPLQEAVMVAGWPELRIGQLDPAFLPDHLERAAAPAASHSRAVADLLNRQYSHNRLHCTKDDFVIYTNLAVEQQPLAVTCLHGRRVHKDTERDTHCQTMGPPFELANYHIVPSYGIRARQHQGGRAIEILVNLACNGKNFNADIELVRMPMRDRFKVQVTLTVFSFSPTVPAKSVSQVLNFLGDWDSCHLLSQVFPHHELSTAFLHEVEGLGSCLDLQLSVSTDLAHLTEAERAGAKPSLMRGPELAAGRRAERRAARYGFLGPRGEDWQEGEYRRINSVGRTMQRLRCREEQPVGRWHDGWGDVARSPQWDGLGREEAGAWGEQDQAGHGQRQVAASQVVVVPQDSRPQDSTIEIRSPEYRGQSEAFGDVTRSPQSPEWRRAESPESPEELYAPPGGPWQPVAAGGAVAWQPAVRESPLSPAYPDNGEYREAEDWPPQGQRPRRRSPSPARRIVDNSPVSRSPSPGEGPSHGWRLAGRDPRRQARREAGLHYPSVRRSPSHSPTYSPAYSPAQGYSPPGGSTEAAAGSRPGSPQASPPRLPYSPILFVRYVSIYPFSREGGHQHQLQT